MSGAIPTLPQYALMRGAQLKAQEQLYLYLHRWFRDKITNLATTRNF